MENQPSSEPRWIAGVEPPSDVRTLDMTAIYEMECREQPEYLVRLLRAYGEDRSILNELETVHQMSLSPLPVLFVGMGASYCSSVTGSSFLQSGGRSSFAVDAGEWLHYSNAAWDQAAVSFLLTTSGESAELVQLCKSPSLKRMALLCNNEKSTCWSLAGNRFPILAGPEYGNATKTYTNATAACIVIASHLLGRPWKKDAEQVVQTYASSLNHAFDIRNQLADFCHGAANIELIGRGPAYGTAIMGALCIREMAGNRAASHSGGGFRHGPLLDVNEGHVAIIFALGRATQLGMSLANDCIARGGKVILVCTEDRESSEKLLPVRLAPVPEPWESITSMVVPQALTMAMIERSGAKLKPRFEYGEMKE
jgi:glucosamine--fructose-6-phosphate aminotransferase (isomerizing)